MYSGERNAEVSFDPAPASELLATAGKIGFVARNHSDTGVSTRYLCAKGVVHGYVQVRGLVREAEIAFEDIARTLN